MASETFKQKRRRKRIFKNPNPLFVKWLTEWREEAIAKGWKTQHTYTKALKSLKNYPVPLKSAKEAKILEFFGDKLCQMLDKKLAEYKNTNDICCKPSGEIENIPVIVDDGSLENPSTSTNLIGVFVEDEEQEKTVKDIPLQQKCQRISLEKENKARQRRPYVPIPRSGSHALMLALHKAQVEGGHKFMKKADLINEAQPLCDVSFTVPDPGSHYNAWSNMSTLIKKGLVIKEGNPARYSLTEAGMELSTQLRGQLETLQLNNVLFNSVTLTLQQSDSHSLYCDSQKTNRVIESSEANGKLNNFKSLPKLPRLSRFLYCYIDENYCEVTSKDKALVLMDDDMSLGFLIKCEEEALLASGKRYKLEGNRSADSHYVYAYLHDDDAEEICPVNSLVSELSPQHCQSEISEMEDDDVNMVAVTLSPKMELDIRHAVPNVFLPLSHKSDSRMEEINTVVDTLFPTYYNGYCRREEMEIVENASFPSSQSSCSRSASEHFILKPGMFEIVLCVDNCETSGGTSAKRKMAVLPELQRNGVPHVVRKLNVGDFLWIAKEKVEPLLGSIQLPQARELVLDFIVERKRMDDLASSIKDGRFREQKFRMKACGLCRPIYLVEDFGSGHLGLPDKTLQQAIFNTQVIDGFTIKRTRDQKESIAYLTLITRHLQNQYKDQTLASCSKEEMVCDKRHPQSFMTFHEFNSSSLKNKISGFQELVACS
ncbi:mus81 structure-specific endonuclease subunit isoform X2 [Tachypleus tridentatus]|uniref:mus81 structure-specific endonuclease subunit isoform X2 n=1 Tax=Tachypleus tridentatus TaxID=6853 RepID=UPI003FD67E36